MLASLRVGWRIQAGDRGSGLEHAAVERLPGAFAALGKEPPADDGRYVRQWLATEVDPDRQQRAVAQPPTRRQ